MKLYRFYFFKIVLDLLMILYLSFYIKEYNLMTMLIFSQILLIIAYPEYLILRMYITLTGFVPIIISLILEIIKIFLVKINFYWQENIQKFSNLLMPQKNFSSYQIMGLFWSYLFYLKLQQLIHQQLIKKKDFSFF